jgi:hypothetical protein
MALESPPETPPRSRRGLAFAVLAGACVVVAVAAVTLSALRSGADRRESQKAVDAARGTVAGILDSGKPWVLVRSVDRYHPARSGRMAVAMKGSVIEREKDALAAHRAALRGSELPAPNDAPRGTFLHGFFLPFSLIVATLRDPQLRGPYLRLTLLRGLLVVLVVRLRRHATFRGRGVFVKGSGQVDARHQRPTVTGRSRSPK